MLKKISLIAILLLCVLNVGAQNVQNDSMCISKARQLLLALNNGNYDIAARYFDETVSNQASPAILKNAWSQLFGKIGNIQSVGKPRIEKINSSITVYIPCVFDDATLDLKVSFSDQDKVLGFTFVGHVASGDYHFPQYADTSMVTEKDIIVESGKYKLPGKYVYPRNHIGLIPIVVLVHGSGPNDMDETISNNKLFKDLAYGLAKSGIGVIRYEKRTKVYASQFYGATDMTLEQETIIDVISAARLACKLPFADSNRIFIIGYSLGAMAAPLIAGQADGYIRGVVMLAAPARPLEDVILEQSSYLYSLIPSEKSKIELEKLKNEVEMVHSGNFSPKTPSSQLPLGLSANYWLFLHQYHQTETAHKLKIPILILQGERDYQVSMEDFNLWQKALTNNKNARFKSYPKLNHLFMEGEGKSVPAEYDTPGHVAEYVIDDIARWVKGN